MLQEVREELEASVQKFEEGIRNCETAEARDMMKRVQFFVDAVDVDTKYDNTAYIIGLASILSDGNLDAMTELKKINKKLPEPWTGKII